MTLFVYMVARVDIKKAFLSLSGDGKGTVSWLGHGVAGLGEGDHTASQVEERGEPLRRPA